MKLESVLRYNLQLSQELHLYISLLVNDANCDVTHGQYIVKC